MRPKRRQAEGRHGKEAPAICGKITNAPLETPVTANRSKVVAKPADAALAERGGVRLQQYVGDRHLALQIRHKRPSRFPAAPRGRSNCGCRLRRCACFCRPDRRRERWRAILPCPMPNHGGSSSR
jgi:hypothetical protein